jgi:hypothetical protein
MPMTIFQKLLRRFRKRAAQAQRTIRIAGDTQDVNLRELHDRIHGKGGP